MKMPVLESLFNKVAGPEALLTKVVLGNLENLKNL